MCWSKATNERIWTPLDRDAAYRARRFAQLVNWRPRGEKAVIEPRRSRRTSCKIVCCLIWRKRLPAFEPVTPLSRTRLPDAVLARKALQSPFFCGRTRRSSLWSSRADPASGSRCAAAAPGYRGSRRRCTHPGDALSRLNRGRRPRRYPQLAFCLHPDFARNIDFALLRMTSAALFACCSGDRPPRDHASLASYRGFACRTGRRRSAARAGCLGLDPGGRGRGVRPSRRDVWWLWLSP